MDPVVFYLCEAAIERLLCAAASCDACDVHVVRPRAPAKRRMIGRRQMNREHEDGS